MWEESLFLQPIISVTFYLRSIAVFLLPGTVDDLTDGVTDKKESCLSQLSVMISILPLDQ